MEPIVLINASQKEPSAIKYCLLSACAASCTAVFAIIGVSLVTQKRFKDFSHSTLIVGIFFMSLALVSGVLTVVFKRMYKYHYNRQIIASHRFVHHNTDVRWMVSVHILNFFGVRLENFVCAHRKQYNNYYSVYTASLSSQNFWRVSSRHPSIWHLCQSTK